jgi:hypothetical protein
MKAPTKAELYARIAALEAEVNSICDVTVPWTAPETIPIGTTIQIRIPKRFEPR